MRVAVAGTEVRAGEARVRVAVRDPGRAHALAEAMAAAMRAAMPAELPRFKTVRFRTIKRLARVAPRLPGALAIVRVTARSARRLPALIEGARDALAAGVQLVWDGASPTRDVAERHVFAALEAARAHPGGMPVILAENASPEPALVALAAARRDHERTTSTP